MRRPPTKTLLAKVRKEFPTLVWSEVRRVKVGEDHDVIVLDEKLIFRFPRNKAYKKTLATEIRLLRTLLRRSLPFAVPRYQYIAHDQSFGGYELIPGHKLTLAAFARLSPKEKTNFVREIASFLSALHRLPTKTLFGSTETGWNLARYRERYFKERRKVVAGAISPQLLRRIDDFFETTYRSIAEAPAMAVIHYDLRDEHILVRERQISGIIDFGDSTRGDPAFDFTCLWDFGDTTITEIYKRYRGPKDDMFLCRSRIHYLRWVVDELFHAIRKSNKKLIAERIAVLESNLPILCVIT